MQSYLGRGMLKRLVVLAFAALAADPHPLGSRTPTTPPAEPRQVVEAALRAVEGDSAAGMGDLWASRPAADPGDRAALLGLATLARFTYNYAEAERRYAQLLNEARSDAGHRPADRITLYARLGQAGVLSTRARLPEADAAFRRAAADAGEVDDRSAEAEALVELARVRFRTRGVSAATRLMDRAGRILPDEDFALRARYHCTRAALLARSAGTGADSEVVTGLELARRGASAREEAACLAAQGNELLRRGAYEAALASYRAAETIRRRVRDRAALASTLSWIGYVHMVSGHYGAAQAHYRAALAGARAAGEGVTEAGVLYNLGMLARRIGDIATAIEYWRQSTALNDAYGDAWAANLSYQLGAQLAALAGDLPEARRRYARALHLSRQLGAAQTEFFSRRALASIAAQERDWVVAERELDAARDAARRHGMRAWAGTLVGDYGTLALRRGDFAAAERAFTTQIRSLEPGQHVYRYDVRTQLAELYARRGELRRAEGELESVIDEIERWRSTLSDRELRVLAFQASSAEVIDPRFSFATVVAALARAGRADAGFRLAERTRARELTTQLLRADVLRAGAAVSGPRDLARAARAVQTAVTAADVLAALPDSGTAVVEYVVGSEGSPTTLLVLTRTGDGTGVHSRVLSLPDSLASQVRRFAALLEQGADPRGLARALGAALVDPAIELLPPTISRLVIVPDGPLHRLPFDALRLADGRYVVERYAVGLAPSAAAVTALWRRGRERPAPDARPLTLLAFGDPAFGPAERLDEGADPTYRLASSMGGLPRLAASRDEARAVARYAPRADVRLGEEASAAFLKQARLDGYRVIHFATHALVDEGSIARTALALAPGAGESGLVSPGDLAALRLNADLVVLSACRTADGVVVAGEGVQGLTAPLLQAGARAVLATAWRIGDRSTVSLVDAFYAGLARGLPVGDALRAAKLDAIRRGAAPSEWAAFGVLGDPLVRVPLVAPARASRNKWPLAAGGVAVAALALASLAFGARRGGSGE